MRHADEGKNVHASQSLHRRASAFRPRGGASKRRPLINPSRSAAQSTFLVGDFTSCLILGDAHCSACHGASQCRGQRFFKAALGEEHTAALGDKISRFRCPRHFITDIKGGDISAYSSSSLELVPGFNFSVTVLVKMFVAFAIDSAKLS